MLSLLADLFHPHPNQYIIVSLLIDPPANHILVGVQACRICTKDWVLVTNDGEAPADLSLSV
jgi:D-arabinose 1-dehydrogenase-like Zn-dependent alcohol dehydrogenase